MKKSRLYKVFLNLIKLINALRKKNYKMIPYYIHGVFPFVFKIIEAFRIYYTYSFIKRKKIQTFNLKELVDGLTPLKNTNYSYIKDEDLNRIINAYYLAKEHQKTQPIEYQIRGNWKTILDFSQAELRAAFKKKDFTKIKTLLQNFAINKVSKGLSFSGSLSESKIAIVDRLNHFNLWHFYWKRLTKLGQYPFDYNKEIGNLPGIKKNGKLFIAPSFRLSYAAYKIKQLEEKKAFTLLEIGGGYGGIYYHLIKEHKCSINYLNFDIPEICLISAYFLMSNFPEKKILLYGEKHLDEVNLKDYNIIIMPNFEIKKVQSETCDLIFNVNSMIEMTGPTIKEYISQINRISPKYFLHINHNHGLFYPHSSKKILRVDLNTQEFELPNKRYQKIYRKPEKLHSLITGSIYYEYLYKIKSSDIRHYK